MAVHQLQDYPRHLKILFGAFYWKQFYCWYCVVNVEVLLILKAMNKILQSCLLLFLLLIVSCSGGGDDETQTNEYISLFISSTEGFVGETIIFSVFDGEGNNVSTSADFYVNEVKIASNTHTFNLSLIHI